MKKKIFLLASILTLALTSLLGICGCAKKHEAQALWSYDIQSHWHKCTACDDEVFDKGDHVLVDNGTNKKCSICQAEIDFTSQENFAYWVQGRNDALDHTDNYTMKYYQDKIVDNTKQKESTVIESRSGNKYCYQSQDFYFEQNQKKLISEDIYAIKTVMDGEVERTKFFYQSTKNFEQTQVSKTGYYVAPDTAKNTIKCSVDTILDDYAITQGDTYDLLVQAMVEEIEIETLSVVLTKNADLSVTLIAKYDYSYQDTDFRYNEDYLCVGNVQMKITVSDGKATKFEYVDTYNCTFEDSTKNYCAQENELITYTYDNLDSTFYNSISIETETTDNRYVGKVNFKINGYKYAEYLTVPVGEDYDVSDITDFFADFQKNGTYITFAGEEFSQNILIFIDEQMTVPFTSAHMANDTDYIELFVKLVVPNDKAWVITLVPSRNGGQYIRYIQRCAIQGDQAYFNTDSALSGYPVLKLDGEETSGGIFYFEKGSVHVFECKNPYM